MIFDSTFEWSQLREAVLRELLRPPAVGTSPVSARVRVGTVLTDTSTVSAVVYGEHTTGVGRRQQGWTEQHKVAVELRRDAELCNALTLYSEHNAAPERWGAWANFTILGREAFSFSSLDAATLLRLINLPEVRPHIVAAGHFDAGQWLHYHLLWRCLVPHAMVIGGRILEAIEEEPYFTADWTTLTNDGEGTFNDGLFWEEAGFVAVDQHSLDCAVPLPLEGSWSPPSERDTPIGIAMSQAGSVTGPRISTQDRAGAVARTSRSLAFYEYPDPNAVEAKVRDFLLNRSHAKARWVGFAAHGYLADSDGPLRLAATLSSVFHTPFRAQDVRPTADGALQFTVPVLLPSSRGPLPLTTSWTFRDGPKLSSADLDDPGPVPSGPGLRLSTAYVDRGSDEYALPPVVPFAPSTHDWQELVEFVETAARAACDCVIADPAHTVGFLWVPRGFGRQLEFYDWVRKYRGSRTFRRRRYGGAVALYALDGLRGYEGETGVATAMRLAQALFGTVGLRTHVTLHFD